MSPPVIEVTLVKAAWPGDRDRAWLTGRNTERDVRSSVTRIRNTESVLPKLTRHAWTAICRSVRYGWLAGWME